ncbi:transporter family ABC domain protein (macronuclear) [Tetrahymena thermophila SB210]|uniref:Transporter family ABC domain protein n=1 Tax=Tetrahymena thermophila (strain SB210) TaxID=312017 RepID=I7LTC5_TETTS|nr:transporter family ABC domain protein [Tetrahymena thermophila SB210]EAR84995.3 transporter family ABC domain protein [Tetrahymena thermophila SB210]|eukprot:XP_001032658.3 transporter family ABC domain protein [Tetrahymena thermophila SB210]
MITEQIIIVLLKNFKIYFRSKEIFIDPLPALVCGLVTAYTTMVLNPILVSFPFISLTRNLVYTLVSEKAERQKEIQKIMGLETSSYNMGWMIFYYLRGFYSTIFYLIPTAATGALTVDSFDWIQASIMYFFNIAIHINFAFFFSTFFSRPRIASEIYLLVSLAFSLMFFVGEGSSTSTNSSSLYALTFFFPQSALVLSWLAAGWQGYSNLLYFTLGDALVVITIMSVFYFVAYLYCDQVIKTEYGTHKHPLFFLDFFKKTNRNLSKVDSHEQSEFIDYEDNSSAQYHEKMNTRNAKISVQIKNLTKSFGKFIAVDDISFTLFEKQIFCLLGHNGAGKTTTISMLTGLLEKTSGKISYYGKDLNKNFSDIRQYIGLCTQKDSVYDQLTIEEHLRYMGQLKGKFFDELEEDIKHTIDKCALINQVGKKAGILSGGNKRKLSMAMSIIGGSKVIFLDEPSSGLDSLSRIQIREIINEIRDSEKTIILTTHHLEEVEELADRTAIMSKGKLLILGTNQYIKKNFCEGYHLTLSKKTKPDEVQAVFLNEEEQQQIKQLVIDTIPESKYNPQSAKGTVLMNLNFEAKNELLNLFQILEEKFPEVQITLEVNTLEDAFVNIGMDKEINEKNGENKINQEKYTDFESIKVPESVKKHPVFIFSNQLLALFLRRVIVSMKSASMIFTFIFPLLIQIGGVVLSKQLYKPNLTLPKEINDNKFLMLNTDAAFQILSYTLTITGIAASPVMDKEYRLRYALTVMGCRNTPYWLGSFIFDVLIMFSMFGIFLLCVPIIGLSVLTDNLGEISLILIISIFNYIGFSYLFSFIYSKSKWVYITYPFINFFIFFAAFLAGFLLIPQDYVAVKYLLNILSPFLSTSNAIGILAYSKYQNKLPNCGPQLPNETYKQWKERVQPGQLCFQPSYDGEVQEDPSWMKIYPGSLGNYQTYVYILLVQGIIFICLSILIDFLIQQLPNKSMKGEDYSEIEKDQHVAEEVHQEDQRVADPSCKDKIKVSKLYKTYYPDGKPFTAISNNSFGVDSGEVMGLLGPNGAGKSTTFNIITSLITKSSGSVQLKGVEVKSGQLDVYQDVGICPQFDSLYENLTVEDHLKLFGRMKGLKGQDLKECVDYFIQVMQLSDYRTRKAGNLSGGNKRKLCVTIALIGGPDLQFFDEPSSGVDPIARRFLWNTLKQSLKVRDSSIVLTTHSMQEAESLCSKIGILVNGKFQCLGSPNFLKKKYGDGYRLTIKCKNEDCASYIESQLLSKISNCKVSQKFDGRQIGFSIQYQNFSFYKTYMILNELQQVKISDIPVQQNHQVVIEIPSSSKVNKKNTTQNSMVIDSYQLTEMTLEQIFIHFSQQQKKNDEENEKKVKRKRFLCF